MEKKKIDKRISPLADLLINGSHEEQKKVFEHVLKKVVEDQEKMLNS